MTAWRFDGVLLDGIEAEHVVVGIGEEQALPGRFAVAGLVDSHAHVSVTADDAGMLLADRPFAEAMLDRFAADGVTVLRDVGGLNTVTLDFARSDMPGRPVVTAAGRFLSTRYMPRMYTPVSDEHLTEAIAAELAAGAQWIKVIADFPDPDAGPGHDTSAPTYANDTLARAIEVTHAAGARIALHSTLSASHLVEMGADSIEHGPGLTRSDVAALGARGGAWTPTICALMAVFSRKGGAQHLLGELTEQLRDLLPYALERGVHVLAGTDVIGTMAREIALLVEHGLTVEQALAAAGSDARAYLGVHPEGDLVTYAADPREHPEVLATPAAVVVRGRRIR